MWQKIVLKLALLILMNKLLAFFSLGILCLSLPQAMARADGRAPELICMENEFFFGAVSNTETITHEFIIANEGTAQLRISSVRPDCGCIFAGLRQNRLEPGESTALKVNFDLRGRGGPQARRIVIFSNDPQQPRFILHLIGEAVSELEIEPDRIYWGNIHYKTRPEKSCEIKFSESEESYVTDAEVQTNLFAAEILTIRPRRHYKIIVRSGPNLSIGPFRTTLKIQTDHRRFRTIEIPMQGRIVGDVFAIPGELALDPEGQRPLTRIFLVYSGSKEKLNVIGVDMPQPQIKANIRHMSAANGCRITLKDILPSPELDGKNILVRTDCTNMPVLAVPIRVSRE